MLNPRVVALQGLGQTSKLVALQGLRPISTRPPVDAAPFVSAPARKKRRRKDRDDDVLLFLM